MLPLTKRDMKHWLMVQNMFPHTFDYALQHANKDFLRYRLRTFSIGVTRYAYKLRQPKVWCPVKQEYLRKNVNKAFPRRFNYLKIIIMMKIGINTWKALHIVPYYYKNANYFYHSQNWFAYKVIARNDSDISSWYFG